MIPIHFPAFAGRSRFGGQSPLKRPAKARGEGPAWTIVRFTIPKLGKQIKAHKGGFIDLYDPPSFTQSKPIVWIVYNVVANGVCLAHF